MKFATFDVDGAGVRRSRQRRGPPPAAGGCHRAGSRARRGLPAALDAGAAALGGPATPLDGVRLLPPLQPPTMRDFVAFEEHVEGVRKSIDGVGGVAPEWYDAPTFYFTNPYSLVGPFDDVPVPPGSARFDFELEVAAVVGRDGASLTPEQARDHVFGYTILNDWSARDLQSREMKVNLGPAKGKDSAIDARAVAGHRRRARAVPGRRRLPRPRPARVGQRRRDRAGPAVEHGLAVRGARRLRLPWHLGAGRRRPGLGYLRERRRLGRALGAPRHAWSRRPCSPATSSR